MAKDQEQPLGNKIPPFRVRKDRFKARQNRDANMLIHIIIVLIIVGVLLWLINNYIPMDGKIKSILNVVVVIVVILWLLQALGLLAGVGI
jgi:hypothetical protein